MLKNETPREDSYIIIRNRKLKPSSEQMQNKNKIRTPKQHQNSELVGLNTSS